MNFKITKLEIENFRSIQDKVTLNLKSGLFSIEGINYTETNSTNGCFVAGTSVKTSNGNKSIEDVLIGEEIYVCGKDIHKEVVISNGITKKVNKTIKLTLDDNSVIECTLDHKIMIKNPNITDTSIIWENGIPYKEAQYLTESDDI